MNRINNQNEVRAATAIMLVSIILVFAMQISVITYAFYFSNKYFAESAIEESINNEKQQHITPTQYISL